MSPRWRAEQVRARLPVGRGASALGARSRNLWEAQKRPVKVLAILALFAGLAILLPSSPVASIMAPQSDWKTILFFPIGLYILLAVGLNVVVGQAGMLDLGYVAFFAVGGYAMGLLATKQHWDFWFVLPAGIVLAAGAGIILGLPVLRLRGDYLAIVTLGFGQIIDVAANNFSFDGGPNGIPNIPNPPSIGHSGPLVFGVIDPKPYYYLVLVMIFLVVFLVRRLEKSRVGRAWTAIREDEDVAELMGVPTYRFRLWAFAFGAAVGGAGGVMYASKQLSITPMDFTYQISVLILAGVVLGGSGNLPGVMLGAFLVAWLPERFRQFANDRIMIFGAALVIVMIFRPEGLIPSRRRKAEMADRGGGGGMNAPLMVPAAEGDG